MRGLWVRLLVFCGFRCAVGRGDGVGSAMAGPDSVFGFRSWIWPRDGGCCGVGCGCVAWVLAVFRGFEHMTGLGVGLWVVGSVARIGFRGAMSDLVRAGGLWCAWVLGEIVGVLRFSACCRSR